jgi:hypothetical protein
MARLQQVSIATSGASDPILLDPHISPFAIGFGVVKIGSGDITFTVQHTFDNLYAQTSGTWFDHSVVSGKTASIDGNYDKPVCAVRLLGAGPVSGTSTVVLKLFQAGLT